MIGGTEDLVVSVSELDRRLRLAVEGASVGYWVEGEVSSLKKAPSGHCYFTLKDQDEDALVECVMYRFDALRALRHLTEGAMVQLYGKATVWAPRGRLQFTAGRARPAGRGALLLALEALKQKLAAEGLFEASRKRALPAAPRIVGVVTSAAGAAFHDIRTVAFRRGGVRLVLSPALVQGDEAPKSLLKALDRLERYPGLEVLIVGRGGGSSEDLMAFNDERVVRRLARFVVPVVSAVGHETDVSLSDWVADVRAATPSQAAELVVADRAGQDAARSRMQASLLRAVRNRLFSQRNDVDRLRARLGDPRFVVVERQRELDELLTRLSQRTERTQRRQAQALGLLTTRLFARHPRAVIAEQRARLLPLSEQLRGLGRERMGQSRERLGLSAARLDALSPLGVLSRGYAIALTESRRAVRRAEDVNVGEKLLLRVAAGTLGVRVEETSSARKEETE